MASVNRGDYTQTMAMLTEALAVTPHDAGLRAVAAQLMNDLEVEVALQQLPASDGKPLAGSRIGEGHDAGYSLALTVQPSDRCYLYLFWVNSNGLIRRLFPQSGNRLQANPVNAGAFRIPEGTQWFPMDDSPDRKSGYDCGRT